MEANSRRSALDRLGEIPRASFVFGPTPLLDAPNLTRAYSRGPSAAEAPPILLKMDAWSGPGLG
ncbi:MAG: hypothetical protein R3223_12390, partial [Longimicrobiales bacterium]|nr:hypothetical protein [Longimicrobiales bacterium]